MIEPMMREFHNLLWLETGFVGHPTAAKVLAHRIWWDFVRQRCLLEATRRAGGSAEL